MLEVIAFFLSGRFSCIRRIFPECSAIMSFIVLLPYVNFCASYLPPIISPSLGRAHLTQMDARREVGLFLFRLYSERVDLESASSSHPLTSTFISPIPQP